MHVRHCPEPAGRPPRAFVHAPAHRLTARISAVAPVVAGATQVRSHWLLTKAHTSRTALPCGMLSGCVRMGSWRWSRSPVDRRARRPVGSGRTYDCLLSVVRLRDGPRGSPRTVHRRIVQLDVEVPLLMTPVGGAGLLTGACTTATAPRYERGWRHERTFGAVIMARAS